MSGEVDKDDSGYFSDGELPSSECSEVTDDYFFEHIMDDDDSISLPARDVPIPGMSAARDVPIPGTFATPERAAVQTLSVMHSSGDDRTINSDGFEWLPDREQTDTLPSHYRQYTIEEAWKLYKAKNKQSTKSSKLLMCRLQCTVCRDEGTLMVPVGDAAYEHRYRHSMQWYPTDLIAGFCSLVEHDAHVNLAPHPPYKNLDSRVVMVYCPYPDAPIKEVFPIRNNATHFVSVVFNGSHFAVLYYDLLGRTVSVFDGLNMSIKNWEKHIVRTIKSYGLKPAEANVQSNFQQESHVDNVGTKITAMVLEIDFDDAQAPWIVQNERQYTQKDGYNCGPIAMLKVCEIYGWVRNEAFDTLPHTPARYRGFVMNMYEFLLKEKHTDSLRVELKLDN